MSYTQWTETANGSFAPVGETVDSIRPGYYDLAADNSGQIFYVPIRARDDDLLHFPDSASLQVIDGIRDFWEREPLFVKYGLSYKRGILLYGPPGSGKTCTMQIVSRDVVERGGIVVTFHPKLFLNAYRALRDIQPETPLVVLMEDFEEYMAGGWQSTVLNLLDGGEQLHKCVFLASTNYPEKLESRIINRPSRFDLRIRVGAPSEKARRIYLTSLIHDDDHIDVDAYVRDTQGLSLAHLKELFVAVHILGNDYQETAHRLQAMADKVTSYDDGDDEKPAYGIGGMIAASVGNFL